MPERDDETSADTSGVRYYPNSKVYSNVKLHVGYDGWGSPENKLISGRIADDCEWLAERGVELTGWGPDPVSGRIEIRLTRYSDTARQVLVDRYGDAVVVVEKSIPRAIGRGARPIADDT